MELALEGSAWAAQAAVLSFAPLAIPLRIVVSDTSLARAVLSACAGWQGQGDPQVQPLHIDMAISRRLSGTGEPRIAIAGEVMEIRAAGVEAHADIGTGRASCFVAPDYLVAGDVLLREVLEPLMLTLATRRDRAPLHASGFIADGLGVLFVGRSGAGKSCLARAADEAGLQLLSDDTVYVQRHPALRVWGWPTAAHLLSDDAGGRAWPIRLRNGKAKHIVPLRSASTAAVWCDKAVICALGHGSQVRLDPAGAHEVVAALWPLEPGFDLLPEAIRAAVDALAVQGAWKLTLSDDPAEAIALIRANLPSLAASAAP